MQARTSLLFSALALGGCAPAWSWDGWDGEPALRLPGEPGVQTGAGTPSLKLRGWSQDLTLRLSTLQRPLRVLTGPPPATRPLFHMERSRSVLALHWRPWAAGAWTLGASLGLYRALPGLATPGFAVMPVASYEQPRYRLNLGLMPSHGDRSSAVVLGLMLPLR